MGDNEWTVVITKKKKEVGKSGKPEQIHYLNDSWVFWYHDLKNDSWTLSSYEQLFTFNTVEDFWILYNNTTNINNGMFYLMRNGYPPLWDHEININGAGWTFKIDKKFAHDLWEKLSCYCVGETLSSHPSNIVGVSISPKVRFVTIRVWIKNIDKSSIEFENVRKAAEYDSIPIDFRTARFTPNREAAT